MADEGTLMHTHPEDYAILLNIFAEEESQKLTKFKKFIKSRKNAYLKDVFLTFDDELFDGDSSESFEIIMHLLDCGMDVNTCNRHGFTILRYAERYGLYLLAKALIERGADVNAKDNAGMSILYPAVIFENNTFFTELLLKNGADPNEYRISNGKKNTLLHEIMETFMENWETNWSKSNIIKLLLEHGANPYLLNSEGMSSIEVCKNPLNREIYQKLVEQYSCVMVIKEPSVDYEQSS